MENNTSFRMSSNNSDTATEESISMYYSFNGTDDKTLENSELEITDDGAIEETLNTVVKMPSNVTPLKAKSVKSLQLKTFSSTPTQSTRRGNNDHKIPEIQDTEFKSLCEIEQVEIFNKDAIKKGKILDSLIVDTFNEMQIETNPSKKSIINSESCTNTSNVLKDSKIWPINNQRNNIIDESEEFNGSIFEEDIRIIENVPIENCARYSLADKMVKEIKILLQDTTENSQQSRDDKENFGNSTVDKEFIKKSQSGKDLECANKETLIRTRKSFLQNDNQLTMTLNSIKSNHKIVEERSVSICDAVSVGATTTSSQKPLKVVMEDSKKPANKRRSFLPTRKLSVLALSKDTLPSIAEDNKQQQNNKIQISSVKRQSMINPKSKPDSNLNLNGKKMIQRIAKTTLNSPVNASRQISRKSLGVAKLTRTSAKPEPTNLKSTLRTVQRVIKDVDGSVESQTKTESSLLKLKPVTTKPIFSQDFLCEFCTRTFRVSSIFEAHKKTHNPSSAKQINQCKYCDKNFAILKSLDKHLLENCLKIPLADRKRLNLMVLPKEERSKRHIPLNNTNSSGPQRNSILPRNFSANNLMPPPATTSKIKKVIPHSGISRTPSKTVVCKPCEKSFDNVLLFAEHVISHSTGSNAAN